MKDNITSVLNYYHAVTKKLNESVENNDEEKSEYFKTLIKDFQDEKYNKHSLEKIEKMKNRKNEWTVFYKFCSNIEPAQNLIPPNEIWNLIFPFGINASQFEAVRNAFSSDFSIIQGPPGTGKTQTILNILANIFMRNKTVAIISNNNAAIENIYEKLQKHDYGFLTSLLGKKENVINSKDNLINNWNTNCKKFKEKQDFKKLKDINLLDLIEEFYAKNKYFHEHNQLLIEKKELDYSQKWIKSLFKSGNKFNYSKKFKKLCFTLNLKKIKNIYYKILKKEKISYFTKKMLKKYFNIHAKTLTTLGEKHLIERLEYIISFLEFKNKNYANEKILKKYKNFKWLDIYEKEFIEKSKILFEREIKKRYETTQLDENRLSSIESWKDEYVDYIKKFSPFILSTCSSIGKNLGNKAVDFLIIDEASQVTLLSCLPALARAKNIIIVGDTKQLPQIDSSKIEDLDKEINYDSFDISSAYRIVENNLLTSFMELYKTNIKITTLKEHYRCHPDIINFCNKMYYDNQLIPMTVKSDNEQPLTLVINDDIHYTKKVNDSWASDIEVRVVEEYINKDIKSEHNDIGLITPYAEQVKNFKNNLTNIKDIEVDTVHKFQGREKNEIIYCITKEYENSMDFLAHPTAVNVAVSRAIKKFTMVAPKRIVDSTVKNDITRLIQYIIRSENKGNIIEKNISIFSCLSKFKYDDAKKEAEKNNFNGEVSEFAVYKLVKQIINELKETNNLIISVATHYRLNLLIKEKSQLTKEEQKFIDHPWAHVDIILLDEFSKKPLLAIEVDGMSHNKTKQQYRDNIKNKALEYNDIKLLRISTKSILNSEETKNLIKAHLI